MHALIELCDSVPFLTCIASRMAVKQRADRYSFSACVRVAGGGCLASSFNSVTRSTGSASRRIRALVFSPSNASAGWESQVRPSWPTSLFYSVCTVSNLANLAKFIRVADSKGAVESSRPTNPNPGVPQNITNKVGQLRLSWPTSLFYSVSPISNLGNLAKFIRVADS